MTNSADKEIFLLKFFYQICKSLLTLYILLLNIRILVILLYNHDLAKLCNSIKI